MNASSKVADLVIENVSLGLIKHETVGCVKENVLSVTLNAHFWIENEKCLLYLESRNRI